jgi:hypothetical protein
LGLRQGAIIKDARKAYLKQSLIFQADKNRGVYNTDVAFKKSNAAYNFLTGAVDVVDIR